MKRFGIKIIYKPIKQKGYFRKSDDEIFVFPTYILTEKGIRAMKDLLENKLQLNKNYENIRKII